MIDLKPINFVTGKGGVGKSVISAMLALSESQKGKKVLLVELGEKSFFEGFFDLQNELSYQPQQVFPNLSLSLWSYRACLREYVGFYIKSQKIYELFFENSVMQKFIQAAPALKELAILGKATSGPREVGPPSGFDTIIIDSYSTGHHRALLEAPLAMSKTVRQGPMGFHSQKIFDVICNHELSQHFVVLKPEEMPVIEGLELYQYLQKKLKIKSHLVLNQLLEFPLTLEGLKNLLGKTTREELKEIGCLFQEIIQEQDNCVNEIKRNGTAFVTPFCFDKKNSKNFLKNIFDQTRIL